jgi:hypothetical protein
LPFDDEYDEPGIPGDGDVAADDAGTSTDDPQDVTDD